MSKFYFLLFQQIVQSLVNQLGVDSAHANISTSSSVSIIVGIICLNFSLLVDSYTCNFVSEQNTFITLMEWYSTLSLSSAQIIFTHSIESRFKVNTEILLCKLLENKTCIEKKKVLSQWSPLSDSQVTTVTLHFLSCRMMGLQLMSILTFKQQLK